jgi:hypothetical protein
MTLAQAILLLPPGVYLKCGCEQNPETGAAFGSAALFAEPPEDGWPNPRHPADRFLDRVIVSISTDETDFEAFENLTVLMIVERYGNGLQKAKARAKLDQQTARRHQDAQQRANTTAIKANW